MTRPASLLVKATVLVPLALMVPLAAAAQQLTFRSVHFSPLPARAGVSIKITVSVHIEGGAMTPTAVVEQVPSRPGPPPPVIVLATVPPGDHMLDVYRYAVPTPTPERACFNISLPGGQLRDVCFKRIKGPDGRWWMDVDTPGYWVDIAPTPAVAGPAPSGKPDLVLTGNIMRDTTLSLRNAGKVPANNISVRKACLYQDEWISVGGDREVRVLGIGEVTTLKLGKLGEALGACPPGSTRVRITADPGNQIAEVDENNNSVEGSTLADLSVLDFKVSLAPGGGHRVYFKATNTGADTVRVSWDVYSPGRRQSFLGSIIPSVASGQIVEVDIPTNAFRSLGGLGVLLRLDPLKEIPESNENNNQSVLKYVERPPYK